ncbi:MAG: DUF559 domain-containing protein, partial [Opitutales bacterium]|nr:DUF559 domain-containing protein [Opitutales bacterium]
LAKALRKNMTPWERKLWYDFLRNYPLRFQRQKAIGKFLKNEFIDVFLACLEHLYGNDIEAQLRACSRAGIRGKIDLTKYRRPTLSDEAILQYEQRHK